MEKILKLTEPSAERCYDGMIKHGDTMQSWDFGSPEWFHKNYGGELLQTGGGIMLTLKIFKNKQVVSISSDCYVLWNWIGKDIPTYEEVYDELDGEGKLKQDEVWYLGVE